MKSIKFIASQTLIIVALALESFSEQAADPFPEVKDNVDEHSFAENSIQPDEMFANNRNNYIETAKGLVISKIEGMPNESFVVKSSLTIAGHRVAEAGTLFTTNNNNSLVELFKTMLNLHSYEHRMLTLFKPNYAFEILSENGRLVLLYDNTSKMGKYTDPEWIGHDTWESPVYTLNPLLHSELDEFISELNNK